MTTMTVEPQSSTRPAVATDTRPEVAEYTPVLTYTRHDPGPYRELEPNPLLAEVLAWMALAGFAVACFLVFALAIWG